MGIGRGPIVPPGGVPLIGQDRRPRFEMGKGLQVGCPKCKAVSKAWLNAVHLFYFGEDVSPTGKVEVLPIQVNVCVKCGYLLKKSDIELQVKEGGL